MVVATEHRVRVLDGNVVVATHDRRWGKGEQIEDPAHLQPLIDAKREARQGRGMDRLHHAIPRAREFLVRMAERGANLGATTNSLLKVLDAYGAEEVDGALKEVLERDALHLSAVRQVLEQRRHGRNRPPPLPVALPDDPRVRDLVVKPHRLSSYDNLADPESDDE